MPNIRETGHFIRIDSGPEEFKAFVPKPLPPDPPLRYSEFDTQHEQALLSLGRLDAVTMILPDPYLFLFPYIRKEAVLSSQIEGTQSSLSDLMLFEMGQPSSVPKDDVAQVSNYVAAMQHGLERLRGGFPLSLRLIREIHEILLRNGRGMEQTPGEIRRSQNWVGGTPAGNAIYVPPPPQTVMECLGQLEKFLHNQPAPTPTLIKAALAHVQFETIHPFLDGNGRLGRLLITFLLCVEGVLQQPLLYLSLYFKEHRQEYYALLQSVREDGQWESWIKFFLQGVHETANRAVQTAQQTLKLFRTDRHKIAALGAAAGSALRVHEHLQREVILTIEKAATESNLSIPTAATALAKLKDLEIVREITGKQRGKIYMYNAYMKIINEGAEITTP